jgi:hypothetical protein
MLTVENSKKGNCMYYAYCISLMYYLRAKNDEQITEKIFKNLKILTPIQQNELRKLISSDPHKEFTEEEIKNIIEPTLAKPIRDLAAERTRDEFLSDPKSSCLVAALKYGLDQHFKKTAETKYPDIAALIVNQFKDKKNSQFNENNFLEAEIYRVIKDQTIEEYSKEILEPIIEDLNKKTLNSPEEKQQVLDELLRDKTIDFFKNNNQKHLNDYIEHLKKEYVWGSEETLMALHRAVQGERMERNWFGKIEVHYDVPITLNLEGHKKPHHQPPNPEIILNNLGNFHWNSIIPDSIFTHKSITSPYGLFDKLLKKEKEDKGSSKKQKEKSKVDPSEEKEVTQKTRAKKSQDSKKQKEKSKVDPSEEEEVSQKISAKKSQDSKKQKEKSKVDLSEEEEVSQRTSARKSQDSKKQKEKSKVDPSEEEEVSQRTSAKKSQDSKKQKSKKVNSSKDQKEKSKKEDSFQLSGKEKVSEKVDFKQANTSEQQKGKSKKADPSQAPEKNGSSKQKPKTPEPQGEQPPKKTTPKKKRKPKKTHQKSEPKKSKASNRSEHKDKKSKTNTRKKSNLAELDFKYNLLLLKHKMQAFQNKPKYEKAYKAAFALHQVLEEEGTKYFNGDLTPESYQKFKENCQRQIRISRKELNKHRGLSKILINIAAIILSGGVGYAFVAGINFAVNKGRFTLFATRSSQIVNKIKDSIKDAKPPKPKG